MSCSLSIIVPIYNMAAYLADCLDTVAPQLGAGDQLLLVDDGSTDESADILRRYAARFPGIEVIGKPNGGVGSARNAGLAHARGEYIAWVDPDDWVAPEWLGAIREALEATRPDILVFDYVLHRDGDCWPCVYGRAAGRVDADDFLCDLTRDVTVKSTLWNKVCRRTLFSGLAFDETLTLLEDYDLLHHLVMRAKHIEYRPQALYHYRLRDNGLTKTRGLDKSFRSYLVAEKRRREIESSGRFCHPMGVVIQAYWFCHWYYLAGSPRAFRRECRICRWAILRRLPELWHEPLLHGARKKLRCILWSMPCMGWLYRIRHT